ncbi:unnamed protein product [Diamesa serratosioi]
MKQLSIFFVILLAGVSVQCASVDPVELRSQIQNQRFFDLIGGIASVIGQLIQQTTQAIENFRIQILENIAAQIASFEIYLIDTGNAFQNYVENVQAQIDALINGKIKPCLSGIPEDIQVVRQETRDNIEKCVEGGKLQLSSVKQEVEKYKVGTQLEIQKSQEIIDKCVQEQNFGDKIKCAVDAARIVSSAIARIRENISDTIETYRTSIGAILSGTMQCVTYEVQVGEAKMGAILENARQCLEATEETTVSAAVTNDDSE